MSAPEQRPTARRHFESIAVDGAIVDQPIVLVDDVVTRGATMRGAASRLRARAADLDLFAFATTRTVSDAEISEIFDPTEGVIELFKEQTFRRP